MDNTQPTDKKPETTPAPAEGAAQLATVQDFAATLGPRTPDSAAPANPAADSAALQRERVNDGRLRKANEELAAAKARIAELEAQAEQARAAQTAFSADTVRSFAANPDDVDEGFAATTAGAMNAVRDGLRKEWDGRFAQMQAQLDASRAKADEARIAANLERTLGSVEAFAPGLVLRIARGDLKEGFGRFLDGIDPYTGAPYRDTLNRAVRDGRTAAAKSVYEQFVRQSGLSGQFGRVVTAPPRADAPAAPRTAGEGRVWPSRQAIEAEMDKAIDAERQGRIDRKTRDAKLAELEAAVMEGRYAK